MFSTASWEAQAIIFQPGDVLPEQFTRKAAPKDQAGPSTMEGASKETVAGTRGKSPEVAVQRQRETSNSRSPHRAKTPKLGGGALLVRSASVRRFLGLPARSSESCASTVKSASKAGDAKQQADVEDLVPREKGVHLCCPCGKWKPRAGQAGNLKYARAVAHWRVCQGCNPPKMQASAHKEA